MEPQPKFVHQIRTWPRLQKATAAYLFDKEKQELQFGFAFCSRRDCYRKSKGRELAQKRLETSPVSMRVAFTRNPRTEDIHEICITLFALGKSGALEIPGYPKCIR